MIPSHSLPHPNPTLTPNPARNLNRLRLLVLLVAMRLIRVDSGSRRCLSRTLLSCFDIDSSLVILSSCLNLIIGAGLITDYYRPCFVILEPFWPRALVSRPSTRLCSLNRLALAPCHGVESVDCSAWRKFLVCSTPTPQRNRPR
jgi:hypothetical protein